MIVVYMTPVRKLNSIRGAPRLLFVFAHELVQSVSVYQLVSGGSVARNTAMHGVCVWLAQEASGLACGCKIGCAE